MHTRNKHTYVCICECMTYCNLHFLLFPLFKILYALNKGTFPVFSYSLKEKERTSFLLFF